MDHDPENAKLRALEAEIQQAKTPSTTPKSLLDSSIRGNNIGYSFVASVLGCTFIGWLIDKVANTNPWGVIVFLFVGFALGIVKAWQSLSLSKQD